MILSSKREMYAQYERGRFGNRLKTWASLEALKESGYALPVVLRYAGQGGAWCEYGVMPENVENVVSTWDGADRSRIKANELADDDRLVFQGEVRRSERFLDLRYSTVPAPMRKALATCQHHADGAEAVSLLRRWVEPSSLDDLWELLDDFDGAVIEFFVWDKAVGDCQRNTVFWEVRHY